MSSWNERDTFGSDLRGLLAELENSIVAYQPKTDDWFSFPCSEAATDWAKCLFCESASSLLAEQPPIFLLYLDSKCDDSSAHGEFRLIDFIRFLRFSHYHPKAQTIKNYSLWSSAAVCFSFHSRENILQRKSEGLILHAPSILFRQLPLHITPDFWKPVNLLKAADEDELSSYVNATEPVNLSSHHALGDYIGPYSILKTLNYDFQPQSPAPLPPTPPTTGTLQEIFWQVQQGKASDNTTNVHINSNITELLSKVQSAINEHHNPAVLIIDDQSESWALMWNAILGGDKLWERKDRKQLAELIAGTESGALDQSIYKALSSYALLILDLRLDPKRDETRELRDISGYKLLRTIRDHDEAIPILMFTSSQRGVLLRHLIESGADAVCIKPTRFDSAPELAETLLREINTLLKPEFKFLSKVYFALKSQELRLLNVQIAQESLYWAFTAWLEARRNLKIWVSEPDSQAARLSALSVTRTAGLAQEAFGEDQPNFNLKVVRHLRNSASHVDFEHALGTQVGYVVLVLLTELLMDVKADGRIEADDRFIIRPIPTSHPIKKYEHYIFDTLDANGAVLDKTGDGRPLMLRFCGAVFVAALLHGFNIGLQDKKYDDLRKFLTTYPNELQEMADKAVQHTYKEAEHYLSKTDVELALRMIFLNWWSAFSSTKQL